MPISALLLASWAFSVAAAQVDLPGTSSVATPFAQPSACRGCHGGFDLAGSAFDTWAGSPMAHAAKNPLFLAALTEAEKDAPGTGDLCLRCHAPAAWMEGRCVPTDGSALLPEDTGVTCAVCHRMDPSPWRRNGQYTVADDIDYRGLLEDPQAPHRVRTSAWMAEGALCGACHDLRNPLVERKDLDGRPMGHHFPEQLTYTEWATSAFAAEGETCQSCHMPAGEGPVAEGGPVRPARKSHELMGGNVFLLRAIAFLEPGLGLSEQLIRGQARAEAMLRRAARLELVAPEGEVARGSEVRLTFRVTNLTGHKLPTGYPDGRRVWLAVRAPGLALDRGHFDLATGEPRDPAALYHTVHGQHGIGPGHRLVLNDTIFFDNRIPPRGFAVTATTAPVGKTYPEVEPGILAHWDDVVLTATVPCDPEVRELEVTATLWYQSVTQAHVEALVKDNGAAPSGLRLALAFEEAGAGPHEMTRLATRLSIAAGSACDPPDAGVADAGDEADAARVDAGASVSDAGISPDAGPREGEDGGCGCRTSPRGAAADGFAHAILLGLCLAWSRRRRAPSGRVGGEAG